MSALRKPVFQKINALNPTSVGVNLVARVVKVEPSITAKGGHSVSEVLLADETGSVVFTARGDQVDAFKEGESVIIRNGSVEMYKGFQRLGVDRLWGKVKPLAGNEALASGTAAPDTVDTGDAKNVSKIEYELREK